LRIRKLNIILAVLLLNATVIFGQNAYSAGNIQEHVDMRINFGSIGELYFRYDYTALFKAYNSVYMTEVCLFTIAQIENDRYNSEKRNISSNHLFDIGRMIFSSSRREPIDRISFYLNSVLNAKHHLILSAHESLLPKYYISIFLKNYTDIFLYRKIKWINFSPGLGLEVSFSGVQLNAGYNYNIGWNLNDGGTMNAARYFISFGFSGSALN
jgi:hypothetical protein